MPKKNKRIPYPPSYFKSFTGSDESIQEQGEILEELIGILLSSEAEDLSLIEKKWLFNKLISLTPQDSESAQGVKKLLLNPQLDDFRFLYLLPDYGADPDGNTIHRKIKVDYEASIRASQTITVAVPIPPIEKLIDIAYLHKNYESWEKTITSKISDQFLLRIAVATKQFKQQYIIDHSKKNGLGNNWVIKETKKLLLRSKFMFLIGKEIFFESESIDFYIGSNQVSYTYESHSHITKHYMHDIGGNDKSHFNQDFYLRNNIALLPQIFEKANQLSFFGKNFQILQTTGIFFKYNNVIYTLWIEKAQKSTGGKNIPILQVSSFYPSTNKDEEEVRSQMSEINAGVVDGKSISFFDHIWLGRKIENIVRINIGML